jgi:hypothetical protein
VAEDGQLIARNRGAQSQIATFEDRPYRASFSGNVVELCPVGALTSTLYRFEGRPWEIQTVPTVCGLCPVGCNVSATIREGKVRRVSSRNHPGVDQGWICDKGRFAYPALHAEDRVLTPLVRAADPSRFDETSWEDALGAVESLRGRPATRSCSHLRPGDGRGRVRPVAPRARRLRPRSRDAAGAREHGARRLPRPPSSIAAAEVVVAVGDEPAAERAPLVDLWIVRRGGAPR